MARREADETSPHDGESLGAILRAWQDDSRLAPLLRAPDAPLLIFDHEARAVIHASTAALSLGRMVSGEAIGSAAASRVSDAIRRAIGSADGPILARIAFDPRRIRPPSTCLLARSHLPDGRAVVVLVLTNDLPGVRAVPHRIGSERAAAPTTLPSAEPTLLETQEPALTIAAPARFTWRTDGADGLTLVGGPAGDAMRGALLGRSWAALSESGAVADAEGLLAALTERRTFRAIPITLRRPRRGGSVDLELSGMPLGRVGQGFCGYGGFGLVRLSAIEGEWDPVDPADPHPAAAVVCSTGIEDEQAFRREPEQPLDAIDSQRSVESPFPSRAVPFPFSIGSRVSFTWSASRSPDVVQPAPDRIAEPTVERPVPESLDGSSRIVEEPSNPAPSPIAEDTSLSSNEHAAFREIARALGVRFAGDADTGLAEDGAGSDKGDKPRGGDVMPFPGATVRPAENAARGADAAVAAALETVPSAVLIYRDDIVLFANRRFFDLSSFPDLAGVAAVGGVSRLFQGLAPHERESQDGPALLATGTGASLGVEVQRSVLEWNGAPAELVLVREAVSGETSSQAAAARVAQAFADRRAAQALAIIDTLDDGIVTLDAHGRILSLNQSAAAIFGLHPREIVGGSFVDLFAPNSTAEILACLHALPRTDGETDDVVREVSGRGPDGLLPLQIRVSALPGGEDRRLSAIVRRVPIARPDAGDPADASRAAEIASTRKSDFLAAVSHEIRTPMNAILGFADAMLAEPFGPLGNERYREYLGDIQASGQHVLSLVNDLLDLAKIEAGRLDLAFTDVPLNAVVSSCVALMQPQAARDRIVIRTSFSDDLTTFVADERSLRQAALNVIGNAIKFTEAGGQVIVSTTMADRGEIALRVRDTGIGMTPDEVETALEPFRQVATEGLRRNGGTGLGLPLTKALVEANHGRFRITSRKDEGTLVEMLFPTRQALSA